ncbi:MAG: S41 family peptidase [Spirochaetes bacterium]|nr:S41 family peptidase [Spirochaetota bacterium]
MIKRIKELKIHLAVITFLFGVFFGINISAQVRAEEEPAHRYLDYFHQVYQTIKTNFVEIPNNKNIFYGAIRGIISSLNDPYSRFLDEDAYIALKEDTTGKFVGVGIEVTIKDSEIVVISPIEDTPAMNAGILSEDVIVKIDDVSTKDKELSDIIKMIKGLPHTKVKLTIRRAGYNEPIDFIIERAPIKIETVAYGILKEYDKIGYLKIKVFSEQTAKDVEEALISFRKNGVERVIVDLRYNPGGLLDKAIKISEYFLEKDKLIVSTKGREGTANVSEFRSEIEPLYKGRLIVLVNNGSASASEIFSGAMKDNNRGKLVGAKTFGKGSVQKFFNLNDNIGVTLTIAKYYTPSGISIHGKGITPDYAVKAEEISKEESEIIKQIYKEKIMEDFLKDYKEYSHTTRAKFMALLKEKKYFVSERSAGFILKREMNKFAKSPLYDLEFDNQLVEAVRIINSI